MTTKLVKKLILCLLVVGTLVFLIAVPASADGARNWYLDSATHPVAGKVMEMTRGGQVGLVSIPAGQTQYWLADQPAGHDVTFANGAWVIGLTTDVLWGSTSSSKALAVLGEWVTSNSTFTPFSTTTQFKQTLNSGILSVELQSGPVTVHYGNYLALKVTNQDSIDHAVITDGSSFVESPTSNPGYPLPELPAGVLMGLGLAGIGGFIFIKRRRASPVRVK